MTSTSVSRVGGGRGLVVLDEERADEAPAKVGEREPLRLEAFLGLADADDEVDERQLRVAAVDGERRDARADDDREREEALADDLAERLERPDPLADALEPSVGADGVERKFLFARGHLESSRLHQNQSLERNADRDVHARTKPAVRVNARGDLLLRKGLRCNRVLRACAETDENAIGDERLPAGIEGAADVEKRNARSSLRLRRQTRDQKRRAHVEPAKAIFTEVKSITDFAAHAGKHVVGVGVGCRIHVIRARGERVV